MRPAAVARLAAALAITTLFGMGAAQAAPFAVVLRTPPPLAKDQDRMPRIVSPATPATARINADLDKVDAEWLTEAKECRTDAQGGEVDLSRSYFVQMRGPGYFALVESEEVFCGGAHPSNANTPLTYDLSTGRRVEWLKQFPASAKVRRAYEPEAGETPTDEFRSPVLHAIYLKQARAGRTAAEWKDCGDVLENPELDFQFSLNAEEGGVEMTPDLPRVVMACGDPAYLRPADLRRLGVEPRLIASIEQSHTAWLAWKKTH